MSIPKFSIHISKCQNNSALQILMYAHTHIRSQEIFRSYVECVGMEETDELGLPQISVHSTRVSS